MRNFNVLSEIDGYLKLAYVCKYNMAMDTCFEDPYVYRCSPNKNEVLVFLTSCVSVI